MARRKDKEIAIKMRLAGASYSQIKEKLNISKSTLSYWLSEYPLSAERIKELCGNNPKRIENFRNTMRKKREQRLEKVYEKVGRDISKLSKREIFIAGLFLYWGEGLKVRNAKTELSNTDPAMIKFFMKWLRTLDVSKNKLKVRLQLYSDMNIGKETSFWVKELNLSKQQFNKAYIKNSKFSDITYKKNFNHGTCNISYSGQEFQDYILQGIEYVKNMRL
ncbi:helix-turn-helix domain-containing protein [Patescibacteria group bacterium]|nr:helix-turn-helix domain-containing protein [Patescibacteria group bacterium]MBU4057704.1 helix-turn-helix domain-containing protein [Patescibacteria group bacterium]MBU4115603.1 helix-turn-helix domain-containing protein [Patescibacteria group bacterium]